MLRSGIRDNAGVAVMEALKRLGFDKVTDVRIGRLFYVECDEDIEEIVKSITNEVMETYEIKEYYD